MLYVTSVCRRSSRRLSTLGKDAVADEEFPVKRCMVGYSQRECLSLALSEGFVRDATPSGPGMLYWVANWGRPDKFAT